jgi:hypothetical protein
MAVADARSTLSFSGTPKISEKQGSVPARWNAPKRRTGILIRVGQLLARAHTGHPPTLALPPCALLDVPTKELVDLVGLDVIANILPVAT